jgi:hypothetical protein
MKLLDIIEKFFSNKPVKTDNNPSIKRPELIEIFNGIDNEFVDLIYFPSDKEKEIYIDQVKDICTKLKLSIGDKFVAKDIYNVENYPLVTSVPLFKHSILISYLNDKNYPPEELKSQIEFGIKKIQNYYSACNFIEENCSMKVNSNYFNFEFEENLLETIVITSKLNNYTKLSAITCLGISNLIGKNIEKAKKHLDLIADVKFDLEAATVAKFYRDIGDQYLKINNKQNALYWYKSGLNLNPNLGVKKLITKIESETI